jgi:hypothetical protein
LWFQVAPGSAILQPLTVERLWDLFDLRQKVFRIACEKKGSQVRPVRLQRFRQSSANAAHIRQQNVDRP